MATANRKQLRERVIGRKSFKNKIPNEQDRETGPCLICGVTYPTERAHILPRNFFVDVKGIDIGLLDWKGRNIIALCANHHKSFDRFRLTRQEFKKIEKYVIPMLGELAYKWVGRFGIREIRGGKETVNEKYDSARHNRMIAFIAKFFHTYYE